jgi:hypothetical protein
MRVSRRTRPSQVGFAASIGRRRLLQAFDAEPAPIKTEPLSTDGLRLVIRLDFSQPGAGFVAEAEDNRLQPTVAPSFRARGR